MVVAEGPELAAAKRLLGLARHQSFVFQRVVPGEDGPLLGVREFPEYRDQIYLYRRLLLGLHRDPGP